MKGTTGIAICACQTESGASSHTRAMRPASETATVNRKRGRENFSSTGADEPEVGAMSAATVRRFRWDGNRSCMIKRDRPKFISRDVGVEVARTGGGPKTPRPHLVRFNPQGWSLGRSDGRECRKNSPKGGILESPPRSLAGAHDLEAAEGFTPAPGCRSVE